MASSYDCLFCDGKGFLDDDDPRIPAVEAYIETLANMEKARKDEAAEREAKRQKMIKSALNKLTIEEIEALGLDV